MRAEGLRLLTQLPHMAAWLPILRSMAPALLQMCENAEKLSKAMVQEWLQKYMFSGDIRAAEKAQTVTDYLSDYEQFMSHGRRVDRDALRSLGVKVVDLESDQRLQDLVLSVHHAMGYTMSLGGAVKIIENHLGKAHIRSVAMFAVPQAPSSQGQVGIIGVPDGPIPLAQGSGVSRQQRRAAARRSQSKQH